MLRYLPSLLLLVAMSAQAQPAAPPSLTPRAHPEAPSTAYVNGRWFNGTAFAADTLFSVEGVFTRTRPAEVAHTIDLAGRYLVPPYGDAHTHTLSDAYSVAMAEPYQEQGIFYVLVLTNSHSGAAEVHAQFEPPTTIDVAYVHGGLTSTQSHPHGIYERLALGVFTSAQREERRDEILASRLRLNDAYWFIDTEADLEAVWPQFLAQGPDAVKIYLLDAARGAAEGNMMGRGLHPALIAPIVEQVHAAGLRAFAHVETADDVRLALEAGVDGFAHLPGYGYKADDVTIYHLSDEIIQLAGERQTIFTPTMAVTTLFHAPGAERLEAARAYQRDVLQRLHEAGARIALGADMWGETSTLEAQTMQEHEVFEPATLLDLWTRTTPQVVFPGRAIGRLAPGYEASFLALACNPLEDFSCTAQIEVAVKQGAVLQPTP